MVCSKSKYYVRQDLSLNRSIVQFILKQQNTTRIRKLWVSTFVQINIRI